MKTIESLDSNKGYKQIWCRRKCIKTQVYGSFSSSLISKILLQKTIFGLEIYETGQHFHCKNKFNVWKTVKTHYLKCKDFLLLILRMVFNKILCWESVRSLNKSMNKQMKANRKSLCWIQYICKFVCHCK